jgi:hypothetical protein
VGRVVSRLAERNASEIEFLVGENEAMRDDEAGRKVMNSGMGRLVNGKDVNGGSGGEISASNGIADAAIDNGDGDFEGEEGDEDGWIGLD